MTRPPSTPALKALVLAAALGSVACSKPFKPYAPYTPHPCDRADLSACVIEGVSVAGNQKVASGDIKAKIATTETSHTLGGLVENIPILGLWDRITVDYERLDPFVLERDLARVERIYRARGYYEAHARAARVTKPAKDSVKVEIVVEEGAPVLVNRAVIVWVDGAKPPVKALDAATKAKDAIKVREPLVEATFEDTKKAITRALTDHGFAYASVEAKAEVDLISHRADVTYEATLGPETTFGAISVEGAGDLPMDRILQAIALKPGQPYSTAKLDAAQAALSDLRVFGTVDAAPQLTPKDQPASARVTAVPVIFRVTPTELKTAKLGVGAEVGSRVAAHGVAGWENRNFLGGTRNLTLEAKPGFVFFPYTLGGESTPAPFAVLPELRVHTALVQPGFVEARTRGILVADLNMYQLLPTDTLGYLEFAGKAGVERDWWGGRVHVGVFADVQIDQPLQLPANDFKVVTCAGGYHILTIPYLQTVGSLDLRRNAEGKRDAVNPHSGIWLNNDVQVAAGPSSTDVRWRPEARAYAPVSKRVTLAFRLAVGILHAFGGDLSKTPDPATAPPYDTTPYSTADIAGLLKNCAKSVPAGQILRGSYIQILQLRGFNSGGTNSNRGYSFNGIGPQEQVPGISALSTVSSAMRPDPVTGKLVPTPLGVQLPIATGGKALWEASVELRFPVYGNVGGTLFLDGSDVRESFSEFGAPFAPHLSTGLGIRYATPVGPLRADFGVRIPGAQVIGSKCAAFDPSWPATQTPPQGCFLSGAYGQAGSIGGVPLALSLAIGEAF